MVSVKHPVQLYTACWLGAFALLSFIERLDFWPGKPFAFNMVIPPWHYGTADSLAHGGWTDRDMAARLSATTRNLLPFTKLAAIDDYVGSAFAFAVPVNSVLPGVCGRYDGKPAKGQAR